MACCVYECMCQSIVVSEKCHIAYRAKLNSSSSSSSMSRHSTLTYLGDRSTLWTWCCGRCSRSCRRCPWPRPSHLAAGSQCCCCCDSAECPFHLPPPPSPDCGTGAAAAEVAGAAATEAVDEWCVHCGRRSWCSS